MSEANKTLMRRMPLEVMSQGKLDVIEQVIAADMIDHARPPAFAAGHQGLRTFVTQMREAFPDLKIIILHEIAEGDLVTMHSRGSGTMKGAFMGMAPTGKSATWDEMHIARVANGKLVEHWAVIDRAAMMQQLGVTPPR